MAEWVLDAYDATYYQGTSSGCTNCVQVMPKTITDTAVGTVRGGSWVDGPEELRAAARKSHALKGFDENDMGTGFRCARSL